MRRRPPSPWVVAAAAVLAVGFVSSAAAASVGAARSEVTPPLAFAPTLSAARAGGLSCTGSTFLPPGPADGWATPVGAASTEPSAYYAIELVPTGRVPGTRLSKGVAYSTAATSPFFGVALAPSGEYLHDLEIVVEGLRAPASGAYVAWVTDTEVSEIVRLGALDERFRVTGQTAWNKFLVVITREASDEPTDTWEGPIIMRGMSRSGRMHTMAGHGPFQAEPCAKYGFR